MSAIQARFEAACRAGKRALFERIVETAEVFVHINLEAEGVVVPEPLRLRPDETVLKFSNRYSYKLEIDDLGITQMMTKQGEELMVFVPWDAMFGIRDERGSDGFIGQWPWSAPKSMRPKEAIRLTLGPGEAEKLGADEIILDPDGNVHEIGGNEFGYLN